MRTIVAALFVLAVVAPVTAQPMEHFGGGRHMGMGGPPAFLENVFPPALIMRNQSEIGLRPEQRDAITQAMADTEKQLVDLQWQFEGEAEKLGKVLGAAKVDEAAALAEADKLMAIEQRIKKTHLTLLVRVKNQLDPTQQEKLRALRPARRAGGPPEPPGPPDE
jgi:Spy/CpxP family protein refolding chaperone